MLTEYTAIRDRLTLDIKYAWDLLDTQLIWVVRGELKPTAYPQTVIRRDPDITFDPLGVQCEQATINFALAARFERVQGMDEDLESIRLLDALRTRIVYPHYTEYTWMPSVTRFALLEGEPGDKFFEIELDIRMFTGASRSTGTGGTDAVVQSAGEVP